MKFCGTCGQEVDFRIPEGDHQPRHVCPSCKTIHYLNPKIIVGCVPEWEDQILLCRRDIEPRRGFWTFPAGFMELNETSAQGAARETMEEACADVEIGEIFAVVNIPHVSHVYIVHRGRMRHPAHATTPESSETALFREDEIDWSNIAFPTVRFALRRFFEDRKRGVTGFHSLNLTTDMIRQLADG